MTTPSASEVVATKATAFLAITTYAVQVFNDLLDRGYELSTALTAASSLSLIMAAIAFVLLDHADAGNGGSQPPLLA